MQKVKPACPGIEPGTPGSHASAVTVALTGRCVHLLFSHQYKACIFGTSADARDQICSTLFTLVPRRIKLVRTGRENGTDGPILLGNEFYGNVLF